MIFGLCESDPLPTVYFIVTILAEILLHDQSIERENIVERVCRTVGPGVCATVRHTAARHWSRDINASCYEYDIDFQ